MGHSTYRPTSCFYHLINMLIQVIFYDTVHSSYMGRQATCADTVYFINISVDSSSTPDIVLLGLWKIVGKYVRSDNDNPYCIH